jgi:hypothetical protein
MRADPQSPFPAPDDRVGESLGSVTAVHPFQRARMDALQAVLHAQPDPTGQLGQQVEHLVRDTVGPGTHNETHNAWLHEGLFIEEPQPLHGGIGVCARLEIGQEAIHAVPVLEPSNTDGDLVGDRSEGSAAARAEAGRVAEDTPPPSGGSITVWAVHAGVDAHFTYSTSELSYQIMVKGVIA